VEQQYKYREVFFQDMFYGFCIEYQSEKFVSSNLLTSSCDIIVSFKSISDPSLRFSFLILVEHQSQIDHYMSLRLVDYFIKMFIEIAAQNNSDNPYPLFPLPIAIEIHQGNRWGEFPSMSDLIVGANKYSPFYMGCHIKLIDLSDMSDMSEEDLKVLPEVLPEVKTFFVALQSGATGDFDSKLNYIIFQRDQAERNDNFYQLLRSFISYALSLKNNSSQNFYVNKFSKIASITEVNKMVLSIIEQAEERAEARGKAEGEAKGKAEGKAEAIIALLNHKFKNVNPNIENKLKHCTDISVLDKLFAFGLKTSSFDSFSRKISSFLGPLEN
jgi:hypothetical protein